MRYLVFDVESEKRVIAKGETAHEGELVSTNWGDKSDQGISVLCAMDCDTFQSWVFFKEDLHEFQMLARTYDCLTGYNIKSYDDKMLEAHGYGVEGIRRYDMIHTVRMGNPDGHKSMKLDTVLELNGLPCKGYSGADIPFMWQQKQFAKVISYCLEDCRLEALLFNKIRQGYPITCAPGVDYLVPNPDTAE